MKTKTGKIPTLAGLVILILGVALGVFMIRGRQIFHIGADVNAEPKDLRISNITDHSLTISWITEKETRGFIMWGDAPNLLTRSAFDEPDKIGFIHYITINQLQPSKNYYFEINSDHRNFDNSGIPWKTKTADKIAKPHPTSVIAGAINTKSGISVEKAIIYAVVSGGSLLSTTSSDKGSWIMDISQTMNQTLNSYLEIKDNSIIEITVQAGPLGMSSIQSYPVNSKPLPPIYLGETYDFKNAKYDSTNNISSSSLDLPINTSSIIYQPAPKSSASPLRSLVLRRLTPTVILSIISSSAIIFCILIFYLALYKEYLDRERQRLEYARR
jgi:hypothetical protein